MAQPGRGLPQGDQYARDRHRAAHRAAHDREQQEDRRLGNDLALIATNRRPQTMIRNLTRLALTLALVLPASACDDGGDTIVGPNDFRTFTQIERLGNPLVAEVFLAKRDHGFFNGGMPSTDAA